MPSATQRAAPTPVFDPCRQGENDEQLTNSRSRYRDAVGQAHAIGKRAADHDADCRDRGAGGCGAEHNPVQHHRLEGRFDEAHHAYAQASDKRRNGQHQAGVVPVDEATRERERQRRHHKEHERDEGERPAAPLEVIGHRTERQTHHESCTAVEQQQHEAGGKHEQGDVESLHFGPIMIVG